MNIPQELLYQQYVRRELETYRAPYDPEAEFYSYVRQGNTEKIKELCHESFQEKKGLGVLSDSPLQNLKYHFTITAAMSDGNSLCNLFTYIFQPIQHLRIYIQTLSAISGSSNIPCQCPIQNGARIHKKFNIFQWFKNFLFQ